MQHKKRGLQIKHKLLLEMQKERNEDEREKAGGRLQRKWVWRWRWVVFSANRVWYVAGRCWPLRLCHIHLTWVSPSQLLTPCLDLRVGGEL